ncbi:hypothetical protein SGLAU_33240 (plasmid) [Streptomyces glaucescens]|uniref:Uncharacterized protein n=1 Tax=Streptomyces glaucescens TaxID=1907 RepID=A0A089ZA13_STRGA|nr:hypothetical protein SGLAU_33240 [Streptomyces glaucescens]
MSTASDRCGWPPNAALTDRLAAVCKSLVCRSAAWGVAHLTFGLQARRRVVWEAVATTGSRPKCRPEARSSAPDPYGEADAREGRPLPSVTRAWVWWRDQNA